VRTWACRSLSALVERPRWWRNEHDPDHPPRSGRIVTAALAVRSLPASAAGDTFVSGWGLPSNLDPHQIVDVPMQTIMLKLMTICIDTRTTA